MKNLLIYLNPNESFKEETGEWREESEIDLKIQIDNSERYWKKDDTILVTNFPYEYKGIKSHVIGTEYYSATNPTTTKINAIIALIEQGFIGDELYWFHDLDAFQMEPIEEPRLKNNQIGITLYGRTTINRGRDKRPSTGTIFFRKEALPILKRLKTEYLRYQCNEEVALLELIKRHKKYVGECVKIFDISYNFASRRRDLKYNYEHCELPIKVLHFHPLDKRPLDLEGTNNMEAYVYGRNRLNKSIASKQLIEIFTWHQIK